MNNPAGNRLFCIHALLIAGGFFLGVAPTLTWLEFSGGSENLVVGTVLEMRRGGPWIVPTLKGNPRTNKPPLTTWLTAAAVSPATVRSLSDPAEREGAYRALAWQTRWPSLVSACLLLVATAWLGCIITASDGAGLLSAVIAGSSILWLRFGRAATTDVQLALWVTVANAFFASAIFSGRRWLGCIGGAAALGLAIMSKGPVALAQTVAPLVLFVLWRRWRFGRGDGPGTGWEPILVALIIALAIALPWPLYVLSQRTGQLSAWWGEIFRTNEEGFGRDPAWSYLALIPLLIPWSGLFILGAVAAVWEKSRRGIFALLLVVMPILIRLGFKDKNERYLLPMLAPAAVLAADALVRSGDKRYEMAKAIAIAFAWGSLIVIGIGLPLAGLFLKTIEGNPWWSWQFAAGAVVVLGALLALGFYLNRRAQWTLAATAAVIMLASQALFTRGYVQSEGGRSDMKPLADAIVARTPIDAEVWDYRPAGWPGQLPVDTIIYLNRLVHQIDDPQSLASRSRSQVVLIYLARDVALPETFNRWTSIGEVPRDRGHWRAYVREPTAAAGEIPRPR